MLLARLLVSPSGLLLRHLLGLFRTSGMFRIGGLHLIFLLSLAFVLML